MLYSYARGNGATPWTTKTIFVKIGRKVRARVVQKILKGRYPMLALPEVVVLFCSCNERETNLQKKSFA